MMLSPGTALWYASRATGVVSLVLLSAVLILGILVNRQGRLPGLPGFGVVSLHRFLSLLAVGFVGVHVLTAITDSYVSIGLTAAVIPFVSGYEPFWVGLGAVSLDLMAAVILTSLLRRYLGHRAWRGVHWLSYVSWPVAMAHSIGAGRDLQGGALLDVAVACSVAAAAAVAWRLAAARLAVPRAGRLIPDIRAAGLTGRGGAAFPVHRKLAAVASARRGLRAVTRARTRQPIVVANGAEGEPASRKDVTLLRAAPHLVLDGLQLAAEAVGAPEAVVYVGRDPRLEGYLAAHLSDRETAQLDRIPVLVASAPHRFLAGQESALAGRLSGESALPACTPTGVFDRGVHGRPTLVLNVESLAHLALISRYGPGWFREAGTSDEPGTMLCTMQQADGTTVVAEEPLGAPLRALVDLGRARALLVGGYHGAWIPAELAARLALSNESLRPAGASTGAGVLAALPADRCGLTETARVARYLAAESAGQCGPCLNGLPRIAGALAALAGPRPDGRVLADLERWAGLAEGRGACHHPDGTVRFVRSALRTFAGEIGLHQRSRCSATTRRAFLPVPAAAEPTTEEDWT